jgi:hypothetical protein
MFLSLTAMHCTRCVVSRARSGRVRSLASQRKTPRNRGKAEAKAAEQRAEQPPSRHTTRHTHREGEQAETGGHEDITGQDRTGKGRGRQDAPNERQCIGRHSDLLCFAAVGEGAPIGATRVIC